MLLNAVKCQSYSFYRFWVTRVNQLGVKLPPSRPFQISVNKVSGLRAYDFIKMRLQHRCLFCKYCKIFNNTFLEENTSDRGFWQNQDGSFTLSLQTCSIHWFILVKFTHCTPKLPSYRIQSIDLLRNDLTGFYMMATLTFIELMINDSAYLTGQA